MSRVIYNYNDNVVSVEGLRDSITETYFNSSTVDMTLYEPDGTTEVVGATWPISLT